MMKFNLALAIFALLFAVSGRLVSCAPNGMSMVNHWEARTAGEPYQSCSEIKSMNNESEQQRVDSEKACQSCCEKLGHNVGKFVAKTPASICKCEDSWMLNYV